ncbi:AAA family ATPase [Flavobacterium gyeonganense]|uniref:AAA family ATPase n=1 Tax=Flavobacterium gyeonganense TaxID=1310418 RepID=UPI002414203A|nr:AAA family ATPase [Flavobacterium gyeonganense]
MFHKNDSYQIPLVINPKRENKNSGYAGIIDINNEKYLLQQRLLSIILRPVIKNNDFRKIGDNLIADKINISERESRDFFFYSNNEDLLGTKVEKEADKIEFFSTTINNTKFSISFDNNDSNSNIPFGMYVNFREILSEIKHRFGIRDLNVRNQYKFDSYLIYKVISMCEKYIIYNKYIIVEDTIPLDNKKGMKGEYILYSINIKEFLTDIIKNPSHISYKLQQTVNYLKFYDKIWSKLDFGQQIPLNEIADKINQVSISEKIDLIELLPPPIFNTKILLSNQIDAKLIELDNLSSGEQQLIHSVSSIIYHLHNINSVKKNEKIIKYDFVNLILDEIELYFHPEFQRKFVNYIIESIKNADLECIKGINILFVTHSPFILSDIPKQNVLFLEVNKDKMSLPMTYQENNTFAANIHEMLTNGFFLNSTKGQFAISKINEFLDFYKKSINLDKDQNEKEYIRVEAFFNIWKREYSKKIIELIGEEYIKRILKSQLDELDKKFNPQYLEVKQSELKKQLEEVEKLIAKKTKDEEN